MLGWIYGIFFVLQVFLLTRSCRRGGKLGWLLAGNLLSVAVSAFLLWYFDTLPGFDMIPGFAYFPEVFASLCAAAAFGLLAVVTLLCLVLRRRK